MGDPPADNLGRDLAELNIQRPHDAGIPLLVIEARETPRRSVKGHPGGCSSQQCLWWEELHTGPRGRQTLAGASGAPPHIPFAPLQLSSHTKRPRLQHMLSFLALSDIGMFGPYPRWAHFISPVDLSAMESGGDWGRNTPASPLPIIQADSPGGHSIHSGGPGRIEVQ